MPKALARVSTWAVERQSPVCANIKIEYQQTRGWEQWGLLTADRHIDSRHSDIDLQRHHLDQAVERNAFVIDLGDLFDAMQGKGDKRSRKSEIRPELLEIFEEDGVKSYLNRLIEFVAKFYEPYSGNLAVIGKGNHETSVEDKIEYDLHDGLMYRLSVMGSPAVKGGYRGWIRFSFEHAGGGHRASRLGYYHHGYGGGGPVTKDVIQANRKAVYLSNADYVFSGHTHDRWEFPIERTRLTLSGDEVRATQHHIKIPSYKDEYFNLTDGWAHSKGMPPKPVGAYWMRFYYSPRTEHVEVEFIPAEK